jgi:hypothetical protein
MVLLPEGVVPGSCDVIPGAVPGSCDRSVCGLHHNVPAIVRGPCDYDLVLYLVPVIMTWCYTWSL